MRKLKEILIELLGGLTKERAVELYASSEGEVSYLRRINEELMENYNDLVRLINSPGGEVRVTSPPLERENFRPIGGRMSWPQRKYELETFDAARARVRDEGKEKENAS